ncbi:MAG: Crp/Fnr family transcriptional regulator [Anaerolineales bacterium]|nr:Crp/Fnr family transcriptional regulator [Chloroflexota bacterium]MBL6982015.1 Crp/Fnr family transcriptional regulator [Anaerolineales bacterium]
MKFSPSELDTARDAVIFRDLIDAEFDPVITAATLRELGDGAYYFMEEDPANTAYVLIEGKVKLTQITPDGQQVILGYLVPGRVFGIIAILKKVTYPVSAEAVGKCRALAWDRPTMNGLMEQSPRLALNALRIMAGQIREFQNRVRELSTQRVEQRVARAVLRLARQSGRKTEQGVLIDLPLSRQDLAEMTGTTLFTVSRVFKEWEKRGLVASKRQQVTILIPHGLVMIAEDLPLNVDDANLPTDSNLWV